ncbi:hypothetical protein BS50DRAFT_409069 [Corynespora cassiicola Philippines]|uniref:Uncharacterized protein n=1 Tax=Corynespora cassiicola Philippines TaxID=1448308 RepID=A0A2T2NL47_CORCC|nr:hypothetical protein BS50DRAFT_409069 [Corynespora cassiicola Philippines]
MTLVLSEPRGPARISPPKGHTSFAQASPPDYSGTLYAGENAHASRLFLQTLSPWRPLRPHCRRCHPAARRRISGQTVAHALRTLTLPRFARYEYRISGIFHRPLGLACPSQRVLTSGPHGPGPRDSLAEPQPSRNRCAEGSIAVPCPGSSLWQIGIFRRRNGPRVGLYV